MVLSRQPPQTKKPAFELTHTIGFAKLYLDDIDAIHRFLAERAETVVLSAGTATADSAEDLRSATRRELEAVAVRTENPDTTLWLSRTKCFARTEDQSPEARALTADAANLVKSEHGGHGVGTFWWLLFRQGWIGLLLAAFSVLSLLTGSPTGGWGWSVVGVLGGLLTAAFFAGLAWAEHYKRGRAWVIPTRRAEARTTSSSMRNSVIGGTAVALVTVAMTVIVTNLLGT